MIKILLNSKKSEISRIFAKDMKGEQKRYSLTAAKKKAVI